MKPSTWIKKSGETIYSLAIKWDASRSTIWRCVAGESPPSYAMVVKFYEESGGQVGVADWAKMYPVDGVALADRPKRKTKQKGRRP